MLDGSHKFGDTKKHLELLNRLRDNMLREAVIYWNFDVILDETFANPDDIAHIKSLFKGGFGDPDIPVNIQIIDVNCSVEEAIARDLKRTYPVGASVIRKYAEQMGVDDV